MIMDSAGHYILKWPFSTKQDLAMEMAYAFIVLCSKHIANLKLPQTACFKFNTEIKDTPVMKTGILR